jgi:predicted ATPase/class 3 adenylate cyclase
MQVKSPLEVTPPVQVQSALRTFLTADVRGYTRFTQEFGDEAGARLATKFAAVSREVVSNHGGEVIELRGDEALAVFESARQALRASVQLQHRFAHETEREADLPLRVGIGLDAGEVVPFEDGFRGGALNLAQRLSSLAGPGEVLASDVAIQLARRTKGLVYSERGLVELKGFSDPVRVIRVLDESDPAVDSLPTATGGRPGENLGDGKTAGNGFNGREQKSPEPLPIGGFLGALPEGLLVARDDEFDEILVAIQAVERGTGRLVLLSGEPGVGKTRLAQEVTLKARNHSFVMASGRCYEPEANVPFYPFLEALATLHAVSPARVRQQLSERWPEVRTLLPHQGASQSSSLGDGQEEQLRLFWAVTGFIQAIASERPVAILLDDLHWADTSSLELLQHLARHTRANRVLLLGTYRDVEVNRQHPLEAALTDLGRERLTHEIGIRRLDEQGTGELVAATLGGAEVAQAFIRVVHRQTEGNPFFVEEVVRSLVERGDVYRSEGRWEGRSIDEIEVPKSVRSVVGQRLSRLSSDTQEVLREASVLGPALTFEDLHHMCERPEAELEAAVEEALRAGILRETTQRVPGDSYAFNHALTQGTLYAELPSRKRRRLHLAAGRAIEQLPEGARKPRIAELAWHFLEADEPACALEYALGAGQAARELFAFEEAERHYRTALELARELKDAESEVRALEEIGRILRTIARYDEALEVFDAAVELHRKANNAAGERWATAHIGRVHALRGTPEQGIERVRSLVSAIEATSQSGVDDVVNGGGSWAGLAALYTALADLYQGTNQSSAQLEAAEKALEIARGAQDSKAGARIQAEGQMWRASALAELGELQDARRMLEDVIPLAQATGDGLILSRCLNSLATIYSEAGQYDQERTLIERALDAAEQAGDPARVAFMNHRLGWHLLMRGMWDESETYFQRAVSMWRPLGWTRIAPWSLIGLALLAYARGHSDMGDDYLKQGTRYASRPGQEGFLSLAHKVALDRYLREGDSAGAISYADAISDWGTEPEWHYGQILPTRAWVELERGNIDRAKDLADLATELATAEQNRTTLVEALRVQGMVLAYEGNYDEAEQALDESISTARVIEQPYNEALSLLELGRMKVSRAGVEPGRELLTRAVEIFDRLSAKPDAQRAEQVLKAAIEAPAAVPAGSAGK